MPARNPVNKNQSYKTYLGVFLITTGLIFLYTFLLPHPVFSFGIATGTALSVVAEDQDVVPGDVISYIDGKYVKASKPFDSAMFGVVTNEPAMTIDDTNLENSVLVVSDGEAFVRVSTTNGEIKRGDFVTSSGIPGVAQKADVGGQMLGIALQDYSAASPETIDDILVQLDIKFSTVESNVRVNLIEFLRSGFQAPFLTPLTSLRYLLAALITGGAFVIGFASFGKTSGSGVEALGRNPLAHKTIQRSIVFNLILNTVVMMTGLVLAYLILVL